eukprot:g15030.t1
MLLMCGCVVRAVAAAPARAARARQAGPAHESAMQSAIGVRNLSGFCTMATSSAHYLTLDSQSGVTVVSSFLVLSLLLSVLLVNRHLLPTLQDMAGRARNAGVPPNVLISSIVALVTAFPCIFLSIVMVTHDQDGPTLSLEVFFNNGVLYILVLPACLCFVVPTDTNITPSRPLSLRQKRTALALANRRSIRLQKGPLIRDVVMLLIIGVVLYCLLANNDFRYGPGLLEPLILLALYPFYQLYLLLISSHLLFEPATASTPRRHGQTSSDLYFPYENTPLLGNQQRGFFRPGNSDESESETCSTETSYTYLNFTPAYDLSPRDDSPTRYPRVKSILKPSGSWSVQASQEELANIEVQQIRKEQEAVKVRGGSMTLPPIPPLPTIPLPVTPSRDMSAPIYSSAAKASHALPKTRSADADMGTHHSDTWQEQRESHIRKVKSYGILRSGQHRAPETRLPNEVRKSKSVTFRLSNSRRRSSNSSSAHGSGVAVSTIPEIPKFTKKKSSSTSNLNILNGDEAKDGGTPTTRQRRVGVTVTSPKSIKTASNATAPSSSTSKKSDHDSDDEKGKGEEKEESDEDFGYWTARPGSDTDDSSSSVNRAPKSSAAADAAAKEVPAKSRRCSCCSWWSCCAPLFAGTEWVCRLFDCLVPSSFYARILVCFSYLILLTLVGTLHVCMLGCSLLPVHSYYALTRTYVSAPALAAAVPTVLLCFGLAKVGQGALAVGLALGSLVTTGLVGLGSAWLVFVLQKAEYSIKEDILGDREIRDGSLIYPLTHPRATEQPSTHPPTWPNPMAGIWTAPLPTDLPAPAAQAADPITAQHLLSPPALPDPLSWLAGRRKRRRRYRLGDLGRTAQQQHPQQQQVRAGRAQDEQIGQQEGAVGRRGLLADVDDPNPDSPDSGLLSKTNIFPNRSPATRRPRHSQPVGREPNLFSTAQPPPGEPATDAPSSDSSSSTTTTQPATSSSSSGPAADTTTAPPAAVSAAPSETTATPPKPDTEPAATRPATETAPPAPNTDTPAAANPQTTDKPSTPAPSPASSTPEPDKTTPSPPKTDTPPPSTAPPETSTPASTTTSTPKTDSAPTPATPPNTASSSSTAAPKGSTDNAASSSLSPAPETGISSTVRPASSEAAASTSAPASSDSTTTTQTPPEPGEAPPTERPERKPSVEEPFPPIFPEPPPSPTDQTPPSRRLRSLFLLSPPSSPLTAKPEEHEGLRPLPPPVTDRPFPHLPVFPTLKTTSHPPDRPTSSTFPPALLPFPPQIRHWPSLTSTTEAPTSAPEMPSQPTQPLAIKIISPVDIAVLLLCAVSTLLLVTLLGGSARSRWRLTKSKAGILLLVSGTLWILHQAPLLTAVIQHGAGEHDQALLPVTPL